MPSGMISISRTHRRAATLTGSFLLCLAGVALGQPSPEQLARGEYLTKHVAMCVQCHSPRDKDGNLIESDLFGGAPIPIASPFPGQDWAYDAPALAGLPALQEGDVIVLLTTGRLPTGSRPRPPMPPFRLSPEDATAVVEYLKSLPSSAR